MKAGCRPTDASSRSSPVDPRRVEPDLGAVLGLRDLLAHRVRGVVRIGIGTQIGQRRHRLRPTCEPPHRRGPRGFHPQVGFNPRHQLGEDHGLDHEVSRPRPKRGYADPGAVVPRDEHDRGPVMARKTADRDDQLHTGHRGHLLIQHDCVDRRGGEQL